MADATSAVRYLLANNAGLLAEVPATRIMAGVLPASTPLPAIGVNHVSTVRPQSLSGSDNLCLSRIQITVHAATYPSQRAVLALVRAAISRKPGTVNGVGVDTALIDLEGPDFRNDEAGIYAGSVDYIVTWNE